TCDGPGHATTVAHLHGAATRGCGEAEFLFRLSLAGGPRGFLLPAQAEGNPQGGNNQSLRMAFCLKVLAFKKTLAKAHSLHEGGSTKRNPQWVLFYPVGVNVIEGDERGSGAFCLGRLPSGLPVAEEDGHEVEGPDERLH